MFWQILQDVNFSSQPLYFIVLYLHKYTGDVYEILISTEKIHMNYILPYC
jgi:hypothetical protein